MKKYLKIVLIVGFGFLMGYLQAQQHIEPFMIEVPSQHINYKLNGKKKSVTVSSFYISKYPESNEQYQLYLNKLDSIDLIQALPNRSQLRGKGLTESQIDFLIYEFYYSKDFYKYPIIGLNNIQILNYLSWKTNYIGKLALRRNGIEFDSLMNYSEIIRQLKEPSSIPLQVEYLIAIEPKLISAYKYSTNTKKQKKKELKDNSILERLNIKDIFSYELGKNKKIDELIFTQKANQISLDDGKTVRINGKSYKKLKMDSEKENILRPIRIWHIKI